MGRLGILIAKFIKQKQKNTQIKDHWQLPPTYKVQQTHQLRGSSETETVLALLPDQYSTLCSRTLKITLQTATLLVNKKQVQSQGILDPNLILSYFK